MPLELGCLLELDGKTLLLETPIFGHRRNQASTDREAPSLLSGSHSTERCYVESQGRKVIRFCTAVNPENYNNYQPGKICLWFNGGLNVIGCLTDF